MTMQFDMSSLAPEGQFSGLSIQTQASRSSNLLALRPMQQQQQPLLQNFEFSGLGGQSIQPSALNPYEDWSRLQENRGGADDYLMEEIRARSHEILENDEMQQMLRILNMGGAPTGLTIRGWTLVSRTSPPGKGRGRGSLSSPSRGPGGRE